MPIFKIYAGIGGGFNTTSLISEGYYKSKTEAESEAYNQALIEYESYSGSNGLRSIEDIMEQDNVDHEYAIEVYCNEREDWLTYYVEQVGEDKSNN